MVVGEKDNWHALAPLTGNLQHGHFLCDELGWVVGDSGIILKTDDGGDNWSLQSTVTVDLRCVHFLNRRQGTIVGREGVVLSTRDGGETWATKKISERNLYGIHFSADAELGVVVGEAGEIYVLRHGDNSWEASLGAVKVNFSRVFCIDSRTVIAVGAGGTIVCSADGAQTWSVVDSHCTKGLRHVHFSSALNGWICGREGTLLKTFDGGRSWTAVASGTRTDLYAVWIAGEGNLGFVSGDDGTLLKTDDGGKTWTKIGSGTGKDIVTMSFPPNGRRGFAAGDASVVVRSMKVRQESWQVCLDGSEDDLVQIGTVDGGLPVAFGVEGSVLARTSSGQWSKYRGTAAAFGLEKNLVVDSSPQPIPRCKIKDKRIRLAQTIASSDQIIGVGTGGSIVSMDRASGAIKIDVAYYGKNLQQVTHAGGVPFIVGDGARLYFQKDQQWRKVDLPTNTNLYDLSGCEDGFTVVGRGGALLYSSAPEGKWRQLASPTHYDLLGIHTDANGSGVAVGDGGTILTKSADEGRWRIGISGTSEILWSCCRRQGGYLAVGDQGTILLGDQRGSNWQQVESPTRSNLQAVCRAPRSQILWACGFGGTIMCSADDGQTWQVVDSSTSHNLSDICFSDARVGYAVGRADSMVRTTNGGRHWQTLPGPGTTLWGVHCGDAETVLVVGDEGQGFQSQSGQSWELLEL